jgi:hypothetical protein
VTDFVRLPIESTPQQMLEEWAAEMSALIEGWDPALAEYETIQAQATIYRIIFPLLQLAANVDAAIFNEWGRTIVNVVPQEATRATVASTWTVQDESGYTIQAGTQVDIARSGDERIGFLVTADVVIDPGSKVTEAGEVVLEAIESGLDGNGLEGEGILIDALFFVTDIAIVGASSGGTDAEDPAAYLGRLALTMQTYIEGVVIARDVEIVALNVPGIGRALALDNYNLETAEDEEEKTTTVIVTDDEGEAATAEAKEALEALLEEKREVNYVFWVGDPTYNEIDVEGVIVPMQGFSQAEVAANVKAAIEDFLDPATFGQQPPGDSSSWVNSTTLRFQDLSAVVNNSEGVSHFSTLKWRRAAEAFAAADIALTGVAPLPRADTITVT